MLAVALQNLVKKKSHCPAHAKTHNSDQEIVSRRSEFCNATSDRLLSGHDATNHV